MLSDAKINTFVRALLNATFRRFGEKMNEAVSEADSGSVVQIQIASNSTVSPWTRSTASMMYLPNALPAVHSSYHICYDPFASSGMN
jgi:hypothetical protein